MEYCKVKWTKYFNLSGYKCISMTQWGIWSVYTAHWFYEYWKDLISLYCEGRLFHTSIPWVSAYTACCQQHEIMKLSWHTIRVMTDRYFWKILDVNLKRITWNSWRKCKSCLVCQHNLVRKDMEPIRIRIYDISPSTTIRVTNSWKRLLKLWDTRL